MFCIVDEIDSILVDEARTPLIISGPSTISTHQYHKFKPLVEQLVRKQTMLCNRLSTEAKELYEAGKKDEAGRMLFKLKFGQPRNKGLTRMMEDPDLRKLMDEAKLSNFQGHQRKGRARRSQGGDISLAVRASARCGPSAEGPRFS